MSDARSPVVLVIVDGLSGGTSDEGGVSCDNALPRFVARAKKARLEAAGVSLGAREGEPLTPDLAYRALGTGRKPLSMRARFDALSVDLTSAAPIEAIVTDAEFRSGTVDDFMRGSERARCTVHVVGYVSDAAPHAGASLLAPLLESLLERELPVVLHAIADGREMAPKTIWRCLDPLVDLLERRGTIGSIMGSAYALDTTGDWEKTLTTYHALVMAGPDEDDEPRTSRSVYDALEDLYDEGFDDQSLPPIRIGDFTGVFGELACDFALGTPEWQWGSEDVVILALPSSDRVTQLARVLMRRGLPEEVAALVTTRGRKVVAFDETNLVSLTPVPELPEIKSVFRDADGSSIESALHAAGRRVATIFDKTQRALATFALRGGRDGAAGVCVDSPTAAATLAKEQARDHDVVIVSLGALDAALFTGGDVVRSSLEELDAALVDLADEVVSLGGTLLVTSSHASPLASDPVKGRASTGADVPFAAIGARASSLRDAGSLLDVMPTVLDAAGIARPDDVSGTTLFADVSKGIAGA